MNQNVLVGSSNSSATCHDAMTVSRADWQRLMTTLETLSSQQAEFGRHQGVLLAQLSRATERIAELEAQNARLRAAPSASGAKGPSTPTMPMPAPFTYTAKAQTSAQAPPTAQSHTAVTKTWAQIAAEPRPSVKDVSPSTLERLRKGMAMLDIKSPEPTPMALYFRNIRRNRLGQVRKALRQMFPHPWAVLGLSFIGRSVIEIVCHKGLADQIVAKLRLIGATHIKNMDVFGDNLKKRPSTQKGDRTTANLERAHQRFERLISTCTSPAAQSWYKKQAAEAEKRLAAIYQQAHDIETSVSEDSGYESDDIVIAPRRASSDSMVVEPPLSSDTPENPLGSPPQTMDVSATVSQPVTLPDQAQEAPPQK